MTRRPSLSRRIALALMEHAARVLPSARGPWAKAMQHELPQIENDLEALKWAGGCLLASYVERSGEISASLAGAVLMQVVTEKRCPSRYESGLWNDAERGYDATKRECRAVLKALKKFRS